MMKIIRLSICSLLVLSLSHVSFSQSQTEEIIEKSERELNDPSFSVFRKSALECLQSSRSKACFPKYLNMSIRYTPYHEVAENQEYGEIPDLSSLKETKLNEAGSYEFNRQDFVEYVWGPTKIKTPNSAEAETLKKILSYCFEGRWFVVSKDPTQVRADGDYQCEFTKEQGQWNLTAFEFSGC